MAAPLLTLPGKVNASHALVVTGATSGTTTTPTGGATPLAMLQGTVDSSNRLVVIFI